MDPTADSGTTPPADGSTPDVQIKPDTGNWMDSLPQELKDNPTLQNTPDIETLARRLIDTKSAMGNSLRIPGPDAGDAAWSEFNGKLQDKVPGLMRTPDLDDPTQAGEFYTKMGRPEEQSGYTLPEIEGLEVPTDRAELLREAAFGAGISNKQFQKVLNTVLQADVQAGAALRSAQEEGMTHLGKEWGGAFDTKRGQAIAAAKALEAPPELVAAMEANEVRPDIYKHYAFLHGKFMAGEGDGSLLDATGASTEMVTRGEVEERFNEVTKKMFDMDPNDPQYKLMQKKRMKYSEMLAA